MLPMSIQVVLLVFASFILPAYLLYKLLRAEETSMFRWLLRISFTGAFLIYLFMIGRWDWFSYYLRYVWLVFYVVAALLSYRRLGDRPFFTPKSRQHWVSLANYGFSLLVALVFLGFAVRGHLYADSPVRLALPFEDGRFYVGQGGNSLVLNYARNSRSQQFALDILELNGLGTRAWGLYPSDLEKYVIYGQTVRSPCDGMVTRAIDGRPDLIPPERNPDKPAGNHVIIECKDVKVLLAHLQNGSVAVASGANVARGQKVGQVGNSGNTTEPHLHIHAVEAGGPSIFEGDAVPIVFGSRLPTRNMVFLAGDR
jgi:hypothetical protein